MKDLNNEELEKIETWDTDKLHVSKPTKPSRVVVSVSFRRKDFELISQKAESSGKKISQFIRDSAINEATPLSTRILFSSLSGGTGMIISTTHIDSVTLASENLLNNPDNVLNYPNKLSTIAI
jgi:hypothetical protein